MTVRFALAALVCCVIVGGQLAAQGSKKGSKAAQRELRAAVQAIDEDPESGERAVAAAAQVGRLDTRAAATALLDAAAQLCRLATPLREARRKGLFGEGGSGRLKRSRHELQNLDDAAEAVAAALLGLRSPDAVRAMLQRMTDRGSTLPLWLRLRIAARAPDLPQQALDWRQRAGRKTADDTLLAVLAATAALGRRVGEGAGGEWVVGLLEHDNTDVRIAAARALGRLAWAGAIEPLIARVDVEQDAVREAVLDALVVLTGQHPGDSTASWRTWLRAEGKPLLDGEAPLSRGDASVRRRESSGRTTSGSYFGIAQTGASILYVFDNSLSMKAKLGKDKDETRWQRCRRELKSALHGLLPDKRFNLVSFANKARCFERAMQPATPANVARAVEWLDGLKLEFQTNVFDALELSFLIAGRGVDDRYYRSDVDTIFFLSDGAPTIPNLDRRGIGRDDSDRILAAVRRWNALGRVTVHAIGIGLQNRRRDRDPKGKLFPTVFLRRLAEQNGGRFELQR